MPPELTFPFTPDAVDEARHDAMQAFPDAEPELINLAVASTIFINVLGPDWYFEHIMGEPGEHFSGGASGAGNKYVRVARELVLARDLLVCQYLPGFAEQRSELRARTVTGVAHELAVASALHQSDHTVEFVGRTGSRGHDFDLLIDGLLATEVKAKEDDTPFSRSSLHTTLGTARKQLPNDGPGLIVLRIPDAWASDPQAMADAQVVIYEVLRQSQRVNAVLVMWDNWMFSESERAATLKMFRVFENARPRTDFADLARIVRSAALDGSMQLETAHLPAESWAIAGRVRRHDGPGPLFESLDRALQLVFDRGGRIACRIAGEIHVTPIATATMNERWASILLQFTDGRASLNIDGSTVDSWDSSQRGYRGLHLMPDVDADVREHMAFTKSLGPDEVAGLFAYLAAKQSDRYVQFRRGDLPRLRFGD
jgi:hypothetical protein